jgi:acyl transferase domain-containing protein
MEAVPMMQSSGIQSHEGMQKPKTTPIAIIGMASIFPKASNLHEYWDNILRKIDCVTDVPPSRWNIEDYYDPDPSAADKTYCKRGGFIPDIDFDPAEFGLPPNILEVTDVSQLLSLVVARDALEDAGYGENSQFARDLTGVILGVVGMSSKLFSPLMNRLQYPVWEKVLRNCGLSNDDTHKIIEKIKLAYVGWEENAFPGTIGNVIAGRIANRFDLGGTSCVVDAACASSLAAVRMAAAELIEGRADMMITGGVDTDNSINAFMCFSKTPAFTRSDRVRTFDAESDGMMVGEGIGMIVLKRLADAERDHDRIYAIIKGIGTSSDGRFKSIYAPRPAGQAKALRRAYQEAGFSPSTVGLIEAHGTGTMAGDPSEFQGLKEVFSENNPEKQIVALGSVKSQIAHTKASAGVASLIKTSLALYHKVLPATINVTHPNPKFGIEDSPFYINTETRPWIRSRADISRRAGVSSFGFGGTNFHVVLEEHESDHRGAYRLTSTPKVTLVSAETPQGILSSCIDMLSRLGSEGAEQAYAEWIANSQKVRIPQDQARLGFLSLSLDEARRLLETSQAMLQSKRGEASWEHPEGIYYRASGMDPKGKVVGLFPGQGSQYVDMGRELAVNFPPIREQFGHIDQLFLQDGVSPLSQAVYPRPAFDQTEKDAQNETLTRTENAQPAIGTLSMGLYKLLQSAGFTPDFTVGHSFGELTALWAAGVLDDQDYLGLARSRGKAMAPPADAGFDAGAMLAVKGDADRIASEVKDFPGITLANWNSRHQVVLAGAKSDIAGVQKALKDKGYSVVLLPVSAAFHTRLVGHAHKPFAEAIQSAVFRKPNCRLYSNTSGQEYPSDPDDIRRVLADHMLNPVLFKAEIESIYAEGGRIFVEFGPKGVLTNLVDDILEDQSHVALALNPNAKKDSDRQLREAVLRLRVIGLAIDEVDPYPVVRKAKTQRKKSSVTVTLNGGLYISAKTRKAFEDAMQDGFTVSQSASHPIESKVELSSLDAPLLQANPEWTPLLGEAVTQFHESQNESLRLHEAFIKGESEYSRIFSELTQMEGNLAASALNLNGQISAFAPVLENLERSMMRYHDHQAETLRMHESYLKAQAETSQRYLELLQQIAGSSNSQPSIPMRTSVPKPAAKSAEQSKRELERLAQPAVTSLPLAEVLAQPAVIPSHHPSNGNGSKPVSSTAETPNETDSLIAKVYQTGIPDPKLVDVKAISTALLEVVSEKTGYPVEMLEPGMDMEADLGIDSIKRVEILGAMQVRFPELPKVESDVLAELRTLGQVIDHLSAGSLAKTADKVTQPAQVPPLLSSAPEKTGKMDEHVAQAAGGLDAEAITRSLLEVVSEKTGYPVEMLELDMDMEADLGIDSIKRVEILGAVQSRFPELPKVQAETLSELHTLAQIIATLGANPPLEMHPLPIQAVIEPHVQMGMVHRKPLPLPDFIDFKLAAGSICLLTDDGTGVSVEVARLLKKDGKNVTVLCFPEDIVKSQAAWPEDIQRVALANLSEEHLQKTLENITRHSGNAAVFIHLDPVACTQSKPGRDSAENAKAVLKAVFLLAKHLKGSLTEAAKHERSAFMTVVRLDGEFGLGNQTAFEPVSGGLFGLVKTLNLEWGAVFCRALDLSPEISVEESGKIILAELHDPNRLVTEVAYSPQGRSTLVVETIHLEEVHS